jgi:ribonuclease HII
MQNSYITGIDEVGRGCIAGPICLASVTLYNYPIFTTHFDQTNTQNKDLDFIRDSKKLSLSQRLAIRNYLISNNIIHYYLYSSAQDIDKYGIGLCLSTLLFIHIFLTDQNLHSVKDSKPTQSRIIADGKIKLDVKINQDLLNSIISQNIDRYEQLKSISYDEMLKIQIQYIQVIERENFADDKYLSVAMASSLAKTHRDELMIKLDKEYTQYNWKQNKGYGTKENRGQISEYKKTDTQKILDNPYLRQSFLKRM